MINIFSLFTRNKVKKHKFKIGDKVIFTNDFGVCWGVKTIKSLEYRYSSKDEANTIVAYHYEGTDTPWFPIDEYQLVKATKSDLTATRKELQTKYGFTPKEHFGCY